MLFARRWHTSKHTEKEITIMGVSRIITFFIAFAFCVNFTGTTVLLGHQAIWRENSDTVRKAIILIDPSITVEESSILAGWNLFTLRSRRRDRIYFQIWRPNNKVTGRRRLYKLIWQVEYFAHVPGHTKFMLQPEDRLELEKDDTIGIYFPGNNPIPWDIVRCHGGNVHLFKYNPFKMGIGSEYPFESADTSWNPCRLYSLNATTVTSEEVEHMDDLAEQGAARIYAQKPYGYSYELSLSAATSTQRVASSVYLSMAILLTQIVNRIVSAV